MLTTKIQCNISNSGDGNSHTMGIFNMLIILSDIFVHRHVGDQPSVPVHILTIRANINVAQKNPLLHIRVSTLTVESSGWI